MLAGMAGAVWYSGKAQQPLCAGLGQKEPQTASFCRENNTRRLQRNRRVSAPVDAGLRFPGHVRVCLSAADRFGSQCCAEVF